MKTRPDHHRPASLPDKPATSPDKGDIQNMILLVCWMFGVTEFPPWRSKSTQLDSPWLDTDSYSVRMKHKASRRLSRYLPDPDTITIEQKRETDRNPRNAKQHSKKHEKTHICPVEISITLKTLTIDKPWQGLLIIMT